MSSSSYDGACSALNHLFIESFIEKDVNVVTKDLWLRLSRYKKGMRRKGAQQKGELGLSLAEGKKPLPIAAYKELARILFESEKPEHVAAHAFLILAWNLIARAEFVVDVKIDATGQISVRLVYNKLCAAGMFGEGNRVRKRRKIS